MKEQKTGFSSEFICTVKIDHDCQRLDADEL